MAKAKSGGRTRAKRIGIRDIAEATGLAVGTVSMALRGDSRISTERRALVERTAARMGYRSPSQIHADRALTQGGLTRIGIVFVTTDKPPPILETMTACCHALDIRLDVSVVDAVDPADVAAELLRFSDGLDGLVLTDHVRTAHLAPLVAAGKPYCVLGGVTCTPLDVLQRETIHSVTSDYVAMARLAVHGLHALGHRRIGFSCGRMPAGLYNHEWYDGFILACADLGIDSSATAILEHFPRTASLKLIMQGLLNHESQPEAYLVVDRNMAGVMQREADTMGRPLAIDQMVIGDSPRLLPTPLAPFPCIGPDLAGECRMAITRLQQQVLGMDVAAGRWTVPCAHHNLPWLS